MITKIRSINGLIEENVTATVVYETNQGNKKEQQIKVKNIKGWVRGETKCREIKGHDPENYNRKIIIKRENNFKTLIKSKKEREFTLGEVLSITFPHQAEEFQATLYASTTFVAPPDSSGEELRKIARSQRDVDVHDASSIMDPETDEELHYF